MSTFSKTLHAIAITSAMAMLSTAHAAPTKEQVAKTVKDMANQEVLKIEKSRIKGLYEIHTPTQLFYTDETGEYVLFGAHVFATKDNADHTQQRQDELAGYKFSELPLKDALKVVRGDGKRVLVTFEDANCGYCKQLTKTLDQAGNVTHYVFLVSMLSPDSGDKANAIWCSSNPQKTWLDWMTANKAPTPVEKCDSPVVRNGALAKKLRVNGTPAMFFKGGERSPGSLPLAEIEKRFAKPSNQ